MRVFLHQLLCVVCALYLSGAHWTLLQTAAWTGMLVTRTQERSLKEAVATTFDGAHPCNMCSAISEGQKQEQKQPAAVLKIVEDVKLVAQARVELPPPVLAGEAHWRPWTTVGDCRTDEPPTPPPLA